MRLLPVWFVCRGCTWSISIFLDHWSKPAKAFLILQIALKIYAFIDENNRSKPLKEASHSPTFHGVSDCLHILPSHIYQIRMPSWRPWSTKWTICMQLQWSIPMYVLDICWLLWALSLFFFSNPWVLRYSWFILPFPYKSDRWKSQETCQSQSSKMGLNAVYEP